MTVTVTRKRKPLVRYCSPFGSPAWMTSEQALSLLAEDDRRWLYYQQAGALSPDQRRHGAPRIEHP